MESSAARAWLPRITPWLGLEAVEETAEAGTWITQDEPLLNGAHRREKAMKIIRPLPDRTHSPISTEWCRMGEGRAALTVALRVLTAITEKRGPNPADVEELRRLAPLSSQASIDELACDVIQQTLRHRE